MLAQKEIPDGQKEEMSQIPDEENIGESDHGGSSDALSGLDNQGNRLQYQLSSQKLPKLQHQISFGSQSSDATGFDCNNPSAPPSPSNRTMDYSRSKSEKFDDDSIVSSFHEAQISQNSSPGHEQMNIAEKGEQGTHAGTFEGIPINSCQSDKSSSQNVTSCNVAFPQTADDSPTEVFSKHSRTSAGSSEDFEEKTKYHFVQQRGRFKITSENVDLEKATPENLTATQPLPPDPTSKSFFPVHISSVTKCITGNYYWKREYSNRNETSD